jgi:hypothetical protein
MCRARIRWFFQRWIVFDCRRRRCVFDFSFHISEFVLQLFGGAAEFRETFAQRARELRQFFGAENDQRQAENQKQFRHADAKHELKLCDFFCLGKFGRLLCRAMA